MKYRVIERKNPLNPQAQGQFYASGVNEGKIDIRTFAKELEGRSSLTRGDIENVLENFIDEVPTFLKLGYSIQLGAFATLRLNLQSKGAPAADKFKSSMITGAKVIFTPGVELKAAFHDMHFEHVNDSEGSSNNSGGGSNKPIEQ